MVLNDKKKAVLVYLYKIFDFSQIGTPPSSKDVPEYLKGYQMIFDY